MRAFSSDGPGRRPRFSRSRTMRLLGSALLVLCAGLLAADAGAAPAKPARKPARRRSAPPPPLVWHVETLDGKVVDSNRSDDSINPASVVKVATSWWALERLGPEHRFETTFFARGALDPGRATLKGDLVVVGSGDPDFQSENAFLVASALNELGIRRVTGALIVNRRFWTGWENGSQGMDPDPDRRATAMGSRLRGSLNPRLWTRSTREAWYEYVHRKGLGSARPPSVVIERGVGIDDGGPRAGDRIVVVHHSKALIDALRRFNCFSNNDIERVSSSIGPPSELGRTLDDLLGGPAGSIRLETTSGLGENRLTPRQIVELMREFRKTAQSQGLGVESVLPVSGCDPSTVTHFFPLFSHGPSAGSLVAKTGTLTSTDGGVSALAGFLNTEQGELVFAVAAPNIYGRVKTARATEQRWLLALAERFGGARPRACGNPLPDPDTGASVVLFRAEPGTVSAMAPPAGRMPSRAAPPGPSAPNR